MNHLSVKQQLKQPLEACCIQACAHTSVQYLVMCALLLCCAVPCCCAGLCALQVSSIVVASTGLPVFQAGAAAASSSWWLSRCFGMCFRAGLTFCVIAFAFYHMPWRYMAAVAFVYAACNSLTTPGYCRSAMAMHSGLRPHADFSVLQRAAVVLDTLVGQGQQQQPLQQQLPQEADLQHVTAAGGGAGGGADSPWEATASLLLAACSADVLQDNPAKQQACHHALVGQCQATLCTLK